MLSGDRVGHHARDGIATTDQGESIGRARTLGGIPPKRQPNRSPEATRAGRKVPPRQTARGSPGPQTLRELSTNNRLTRRVVSPYEADTHRRSTAGTARASNAAGSVHPGNGRHKKNGLDVASVNSPEER